MPQCKNCANYSYDSWNTPNGYFCECSEISYDEYGEKFLDRRFEPDHECHIPNKFQPKEL